MHLALVKIEDAGSNLVKAVIEEHKGDKEDCPVCHPKNSNTTPATGRHRLATAPWRQGNPIIVDK